MHGSTMSPANQYSTSQYFSPVSCLVMIMDSDNDDMTMMMAIKMTTVIMIV